MFTFCSAVKFRRFYCPEIARTPGRTRFLTEADSKFLTDSDFGFSTDSESGRKKGRPSENDGVTRPLLWPIDRPPPGKALSWTPLQSSCDLRFQNITSADCRVHPIFDLRQVGLSHNGKMHTFSARERGITDRHPATAKGTKPQIFDEK
ncbi:unnamed protein product [Cyprideis torosa]|uniref:Uncharacterized protein n=1 Tax=Cyprideis torosa TaxID=163714 RepID=A0A7R8WQA7_9CRUS|nr:unnamed protein product [Cyprideis torosa]CAG0905850.1 unnamed protein product [Cyprideis torosa]